MSEPFKLDLNTLHCFSYHWFWGLRYHKTPELVTMATELMKLMHDENQLIRIIKQQQTLDQQFAPVRFFYWLFNVNNATHNAYLLAACKAHQNHLFHSQEDNLAMEHLLSFSSRGVTYAIDKMHSFANFMSAPKVSGLKPSHAVIRLGLAEQVNPMRSSPIQSHMEVITVTSAMQSDLIALSINLGPGDLLSRSAFKNACKKTFLATHPDKGAENKDAFERAIMARDSLAKHFSSDNSNEYTLSENDEYECWEDYYADVEKIRADQDFIAACQKQRREDLLRLEKEINAMKATTDRMNTINDELDAVVGEVNAETDKINAETDRINAATDNLTMDVEAMSLAAENLRIQVDAFLSQKMDASSASSSLNFGGSIPDVL